MRVLVLNCNNRQCLFGKFGVCFQKFSSKGLQKVGKGGKLVNSPESELNLILAAHLGAGGRTSLVLNS